MSENNFKLKALITELNKRRENSTKEGVPVIQELYKTRIRKKKKPYIFKDSSFLYIRSYDGDIGNRPIPSGQAYWRSPDVSFTPINGTMPLATNELHAGEAYLVRCRLYNRGDLTVPFPKVEFFLTDPTLGFDTRFSTNIGLTQMNGLLLSNGVGEAQFVYRVPPEEVGHKCFFARTYSFSPLDKPIDIHALYPVDDRHIGQRNLHIIAQATAYNFNLIHMPNAEEIIQFVPLSINEIVGLGDTTLGNFQFKEARSADIFYEEEIKVQSINQNIQITHGREGIRISTQGEGPDIREQSKIAKACKSAVRRIHAGKARPSQFKELFKEHHRMNDFIQNTRMTIKLPQLGLSSDEAMAWNIVNSNTITGEIKGGITLILIGKG